MTRVLEGAIFSPEEVQIMQTALAEARRALLFAYPSGAPFYVRLRLAASIVEIASAGERNPVRLCSRALGRLEPAEALYVPRRDLCQDFQVRRTQRTIQSMGRRGVLQASKRSRALSYAPHA